MCDFFAPGEPINLNRSRKPMKHAQRCFLAVALMGAVALVGCSSGEWEPGPPGPQPQVDAAPPVTPPPPPPKTDSGTPQPPPKTDSGTPQPPPPKTDSGTPQPPPKQDSGTPTPPPKLDSGTPQPPPKQDSGTPPPPPPPPPPLTNKVAAVQYSKGQASLVDSACVNAPDPGPDVCALKKLVSEAHAQGASYVVLPEYAIAANIEQTPVIGDNPGTDPAWPADWVIKAFSQQAKQLGIYLVANTFTLTPNSKTCSADADCPGNEGCLSSGKCAKFYNTSIAFSPGGSVVGVHHKFNLFGNEPNWLTAGTTVSTFGTPLGPMGMLICADIYGNSTLLNQLAATAKVVAVSSFWTVSGATSSFKSHLAEYPHSFVANTTSAPGNGGGIYKGAVPKATALAEKISTTPNFVIYALPPAP
jgi:predicted amidohydrolase